MSAKAFNKKTINFHKYYCTLPMYEYTKYLFVWD